MRRSRRLLSGVTGHGLPEWKKLWLATLWVERGSGSLAAPRCAETRKCSGAGRGFCISAEQRFIPADKKVSDTRTTSCNESEHVLCVCALCTHVNWNKERKRERERKRKREKEKERKRERKRKRGLPRIWLCSTRALHSARVCCRRRATFLRGKKKARRGLYNTLQGARLPVVTMVKLSRI